MDSYDSNSFEGGSGRLKEQVELIMSRAMI